MTMSIRATRVLREMQRRVLEERLEREAAECAALEEYTRNFLSREAAAEYLKISIHKLRRHITAGTGPAFIKYGTAAQSTVRFPRRELDEWMADPAAYQATRADRMVALARSLECT